MANIRSAEKQRRQAEKRKERNRAGKSRLKSALKKVRASVEAGGELKDVVSTGFSEIDKAAKRGIIKSNTADRYKSRLAAASKRSAAAAK
jgi:small subunit ribosomal protein S20